MGIADGKLLVIMLVIHDGVVARNLFIARDESILSKDSYYIGTVLQWQTLLHFKNLHYKLYDMGGLIKGPSSLNDYKISFGGEIVPTFEYEAVLTNSAKALVKISQGLSYLVDKFKMLRTQYK